MEVIIDITGAQVDPLTLQQIRDEESLKQCFLARRQNINKLIQDTAAALKKIKSDKEGEAAVNTFNKKLETEIKTLQKELQLRANIFVMKQKKNVNDLFWAQAKLVVRVVWAFAKYVKGGLEIGGKVGAAVTAGVTPGGAFLSVVAIKSIINSVNDCNSAVDELQGALEGERSQFLKLREAIKELKKLKKPDKVPQSKIDAVSNLMGPYGARLLGVDVAAKTSATKLDHLLKDLDKGKFRNKSAQEEVEKKVDSLIHKIIERSKNVAEGRKLLQTAKDKVKDASQRAPRLVLGRGRLPVESLRWIGGLRRGGTRKAGLRHGRRYRAGKAQRRDERRAGRNAHQIGPAAGLRCPTVFGNAVRSLTLAAQKAWRNQRDRYRATTVREWFSPQIPKTLTHPRGNVQDPARGGSVMLDSR
jgi:hypothetical protein